MGRPGESWAPHLICLVVSEGEEGQGSHLENAPGLGHPRAGKSQAQSFGTLLIPSGAVPLGMSLLERREGKVLIGSRVGAKGSPERVAGWLPQIVGKKAEALEPEGFRNPC